MKKPMKRKQSPRSSDTSDVTLGGLDLDFTQAPTTWEFLHNTSFFRGLLGPVGCLAGEVQVLTEYGPMPISDINRPMRVVSWNSKKGLFQLSWCGGSFPKGTDYLYQVSTQEGKFVSSGHHLTYDASCEYRLVQDLRVNDALSAGSGDLLQTLLSSAQLSSPQDAHRSTEIAVDFLASYAKSARQYGQRFLSEANTFQEPSPSQGDVQKLILSHGSSAFWRMGGLVEQLLKHTRQGLSCVLKQIGDYSSQILPLHANGVGQVSARYGLYTSAIMTPHSIFEQKSECRQPIQQPVQSSHSSKSCSISNRPILEIKREEVKRVYWDMQVLDTHNYVTIDGTIHHNSGKSYGCAAEIFLKAVQQEPSPIDNVRYTRFVIVRNSYPELRTTTIKTWGTLFPEDVWGPMRWSPPITHHLKLPSRDGIPGVDCEVIFLALDQPKDVRKLLSLELTGAWVNEARELPLAVIQGLTHRVGRYPTKQHGGPTWRGIWADTNPMDNDHWWYRLAEKEPIRGRYKWSFFKQPSGMLECTGDTPGALPAAGRFWTMNPDAENVGNLPPGYYEQQLGGKNLDWIRCYIGGEYVYVQEGKAVWPEYTDSLMSVEVLDYDPSVPIQVGLDFGLTPAAVIGQKMRNGRWHILHEIVSFSMGLERFGQILIHDIQTRFPKAQIFIWGDPAGVARDGIFEVTAFDYLKTLGLNAQPTASNDFMVRREAGALPMQRFIDGKPGIIVAHDCQRLRKSLAGGYHFKRVGVGGGTDRFKDAPNKNEHSHIGDAYGYLMLGGGEFRTLTRGHMMGRSQPRATIANHDFEIFA